MNRCDFFKRLGVAGAVCAVAPMAVATTVKSIPIAAPLRFIEPKLVPFRFQMECSNGYIEAMKRAAADAYEIPAGPS